MEHICPVCKTELTEQISKCPTCGFNELNKDFISPEDAQAWFERVVVPFREEWENNSINLKDFKIKGTTLVKYKRKRNKVKIPSGVTSIGDEAFKGCSSLTEINIPEGVISIGKNAFFKCSSLTKIIIPEGVTSISDNAFAECSSLTEIIIPNSVTSIGYHAFKCCSSLTEITIPKNLTWIAYNAFEYCSSLTKIRLHRPACFSKKGVPYNVEIIDCWRF